MSTFFLEILQHFSCIFQDAAAYCRGLAKPPRQESLCEVCFFDESLMDTKILKNNYDDCRRVEIEIEQAMSDADDVAVGVAVLVGVALVVAAAAAAATAAVIRLRPPFCS